ncbi:MAG: CopG family transcriptional regulator [Clostridium perfringens]|uniref:CopG family transcriptional regulator n=2 Tax=Clostridium perfringens TaxID=1502 RepID=A0AAW9KFZ0_CLOPF|nr:CopG family transcriptional regulator [Clostridium perfringens]MDZ7542198.1 CopG family transcriptional regulator [Clostridium perfringens]
MGRPKAEKPKNESIKVRFDSELFEELNNYCKENKLTKARAIRNGVKLLLETEKNK